MVLLKTELVCSQFFMVNRNGIYFSSVSSPAAGYRVWHIPLADFAPCCAVIIFDLLVLFDVLADVVALAAISGVVVVLGRSSLSCFPA